MMVVLRVPDDGYSECTWWWLFWAYLMNVILSVPDDGYSECTWWWLFWVYLIIIRCTQNNHHQVLSEQPSSGTLRKTPSGTLRTTIIRYTHGYSERTWWWLFWVYLMVILSVPDGYSECTWWWLFWVYLMMVILSVPDVQNNHHQLCSEYPSSGMLRITIIRNAQNNHHQVHSE
jgi:hypothetical protein